jgi:hypothetical protein
MFNLSDQTREEIVAILRERFSLTQSDENINEVIDEVVDAVKKQFGM